MISALSAVLLLVGIVSVASATEPGIEARQDGSAYSGGGQGSPPNIEEDITAKKNLRPFRYFRSAIALQDGHDGKVYRIDGGGFRLVVLKAKTDGAKNWGIQVIGTEKVELKAGEECFISFSYLSNTSFPLGFSVHPEGQTHPEYLISDQEVDIRGSGKWKHAKVPVEVQEFNSKARPVFHFKVGFAPVDTDLSLKDLVIQDK